MTLPQSTQRPQRKSFFVIANLTGSDLVSCHLCNVAKMTVIPALCVIPVKTGIQIAAFLDTRFSIRLRPSFAGMTRRLDKKRTN